MRNPASANASANTPMSLAPQGGQPADPAPTTRMAATNPAHTAPVASGGYLVQVSSQRNEADAQASFKALQTKFPNVLGSQSLVIKRADLEVRLRRWRSDRGRRCEMHFRTTCLREMGGNHRVAPLPRT